MAIKKKLSFSRMNKTQLRRLFERTNRLSVILRIALHELKLVEKSKRFVVDMSDWCAMYVGSKECRVCLAGSCMVGMYDWREKLLKGGIRCGEFGLSPSDFRGHDRSAQKFEALNALRVGGVQDAVDILGLGLSCQCLDRDVVSYDEDSKKWREQMEQLVRDLEGLDI